MIDSETLRYLESHCWAEVSLDAFRNNFRIIKDNVGGAPVCAVIKADAYGHGDLAIARLLAEEGSDWFAVSSLPEALRLRRGGISQPILILGHTMPSLAPLLAENNITQALFSLEYARELSSSLRAGQTLQCHLKTDTGMGRIGFPVGSDMEKALSEMEQCFHLSGLNITGIFQHFAVADSNATEDISYTDRQFALFTGAIHALKSRGYKLDTCHCCNSAGQLVHPERCLDLVRAGIILYGCAPSEDVPVPAFRQAMSVKTRISQIKTLLPGESISYGRTFTAENPTRVATCCIGYADGYPRALSNKGVFTIHGKPAPVVGRVCMDQLLVDVTAIPEAAVGDEVIAFGPGLAGDSVDDIAEKIGTINYELLCGISRRVPRIYLENGTAVSAADYLE